jgi:hypothetical protein
LQFIIAARYSLRAAQGAFHIVRHVHKIDMIDSFRDLRSNRFTVISNGLFVGLNLTRLDLRNNPFVKFNSSEASLDRPTIIRQLSLRNCSLVDIHFGSMPDLVALFVFGS